ncbi:MAG: CRISPR-associated helicase Cas3' [Pseudomonadota bacterium]
MIADYLWAKYGSDDGLWHPIILHMLDVAAVAGFVWEHNLDDGLRKRLESSFPSNDIKSLIMFLAGAHDIGKASPGFQKRVWRIAECSGFLYSENDRNCPHGQVTAVVLREFLPPTFSLLGQISGGHHGVFPRSSQLQLGKDSLGNKQWQEARTETLIKFAGIVGFDFRQQPTPEISDPLVVSALAGFISVVDWIGSNQDFFPCFAVCGKVIEIDPANYWKEAQNKARRALGKLGWFPGVTFDRETSFDQVFATLTANSLQSATIDLSSGQNNPYLMIVEAPMGEGKTEAALYAADLAMCRGFARGMYIAMPTQATGNAMFKRVLDSYLRKRGHKGKLNLQLVHGDALLAQMADVQEGEVPVFKPENIGEDGADVEAQSWFTAKKRPLLAPFGVGTIDQSLLSVLQTKHWFVRLFGLAGKVIIFDEVHAYDAYMSTILERLLHWLAELDCTVILLSATLPEAKRKALAKAYSGREDVEYRRYPRITLAKPRHYPQTQADKLSVCTEIPMEKSRTIDLQFCNTDLAEMTSTLAERLKQGGCAAVICNTVNRSIEVYRHLRDTLENTECMLFHARTLQMWRREREEEVLRKFGKRDLQEKDAEGRFINPDRPHRGVLVATQIVEQSLDLDFDFMVSEIAPVDLLLQRSGRLHRHPRKRPPGLETPRLIVLCGADRVGPPPESFGKSIEYVYDRYILLRTWLALRGRNEINAPDEIESLVEAVYGESSEEADESWRLALEQADETMAGEYLASKTIARQLLVAEPQDPADLVEEFNSQLLDDENPEAHKTVKAATREGAPSITVVILPADTRLTHEPTISEVRRLLDSSVKLSHKALFQAFLQNGEAPEQWKENAHLRHARLMRLVERNSGRVGNYRLTLDKQLGLVIETKEG